jgi:hypothetical protein
MAYGTYASADTLATTQQSIVAYGEDRAWADIEALLAAHNQITDEMRGNLIELTTDRQRRYGSQDSMTMQKVDEFGRAYAQKITAGSTVGFPLEGYEIATQWTRLYFENATGAEMFAQVTAIKDADVSALQNSIKNALFGASNFTFVDRRVDGVSLAVKRLVNADSASIPVGPSGTTFVGATHTHYLARVGTLAASDISAVVNTVIEHHAVGRARLYIARADEAAVRAFTSNFLAYSPVTVVNNTAGVIANGTLEITNPNDRAIGLWDQIAEVSVKPWMPANYMFAWVDGAPAPLVMRVRNNAMGNLQPFYEDEVHPLRARAWGREYGMGAWTRTNGAVLYIGGTTYVSPSF